MLVVGSRITIGWDYPDPDSGLITSGTVIGWAENDERESDVRSAVVELDQPLTTVGTIVGSSARAERTGRLLVLDTRYEGQTWDGDEGTVHVVLTDVVPAGSRDGELWIASHGVYRVE